MRPAEIKALTSLRGVAALWVVAFHMRHEVERLFVGELVLDPVLKSGFLGVDLFFVLSGLVIGLNYYAEFENPTWPAYVGFVRRRFARIYPAYLVALVLVVTVFLSFEWFGYAYHRPTRFTMGTLIESVCLVQAWTYPVRANWNIPDWSVSAEWLGYLCFPGFVVLARALRSRWTIGLGLIALLTLNAVVLHFVDRGGSSAMALALLRLVVGFGLGLLLYRFRAAAQPASRAWPWLSLIAATSVPFLYAASKNYGADPLAWAPAIFGLVVYGLAAPNAGLPLLTARAPVYLGTISYSVYLLHDIVLLAARAVYNARELAAASAASKLLYLGALLGVVLIGAHLLYRYVEAPWRSKLAGRRRPG